MEEVSFAPFSQNESSEPQNKVKVLLVLQFAFQSLRFCKGPLPGLEVFNAPRHKAVLVLIYIDIYRI